jgi:hypothetical protein
MRTEFGLYPTGDTGKRATPVAASSGNVAAAVAAAAIAAGGANVMSYLSGFEVTGSGATAGLPVTVTVTGAKSGTLSYTYTAVAGVLLGNTPLVVGFNPPLEANALNTAITVSCPSLGAGNTNNTVDVHGYQIPFSS